MWHLHFRNVLVAAIIVSCFLLVSPIAAVSIFRSGSAPSTTLYTDAEGNCRLPAELKAEIAAYRPTVNRIIDAIVKAPFAGDVWLSLSTFIERFGPRHTGTAVLESAIDAVVEEMTARGLENVHTEDAMVPHWERGFESADLVKPYAQRLNILGLGSSVGTPRGGIIAPVLAVRTFEEFAAISDTDVSGHIVLFAPEWHGYGETSKYRSRAASVAAGKGAVAALVRSITPFSIGSPHTGQQTYEAGVRKIPVAAVTVEDAEKMLTMCRRGTPVEVRLEMGARNFPDPVLSRNTIAEVRGKSAVAGKNESVVVLAGHLDSWDIGNGAMDDAGGAFVAWKALDFLLRLGLRPRRSLRAILWTAEEQGYVGAKEYRERHRQTEEDEFAFFLESDSGTFEPTGLALTGNKDAECLLQEVLQLMAPLNATELKTPSEALSDLEWWADDGFPSASLETRNEQYFLFHHSAGDSYAGGENGKFGQMCGSVCGRRLCRCRFECGYAANAEWKCGVVYAYA